MKEQAGKREETNTKWRRGIGRCSAVRYDVVCRGSSAWPYRGTGLRASARRGAVCHAVVLPADIFIGDRATCNRLRGIRTERCFAHLYPRFAARPIQRQPSLSVLALSRFSLPSSSPSLSHLSFTSSPSPLLSPALSVSAPAITVRAMPLKGPRVVLSDVEQRRPTREMTY